jgi:hypothetical protein
MSDFHPGSVRRFLLFAYVCPRLYRYLSLVEPCVERRHNVRSTIYVALHYNSYPDIVFVLAD